MRRIWEIWESGKSPIDFMPYALTLTHWILTQKDIIDYINI